MSKPCASLDYQAVLMDLDGTLYHLRPMQRRMALALALSSLRLGPLGAWRLARALARFRRQREVLRELGRPEQSLQELQYTTAAQQLGLGAAELEALVVEWMHHRPLRHLAACRRSGLEDFMARAGAAGLQLGVFSDYPARAKLEALGVAQAVSLEVAATDPEVNAFKPHPAGFLWACEAWGLAPEQVLYVGDRPTLDGAGARAAGMDAVVFSGSGEQVEGLPTLPDFEALARYLGV